MLQKLSFDHLATCIDDKLCKYVATGMTRMYCNVPMNVLWCRHGKQIGMADADYYLMKSKHIAD